jgi:uncharacterized protein (DUF1778 family)
MYDIVIQCTGVSVLPAAINPPVSVRVSPSEREILAAAAAQARTNLSDFVRRSALEAAEIELLVHPLVTIPAADWERFEAWAHAPAKTVPALLDLAATRPAWQE